METGRLRALAIGVLVSLVAAEGFCRVIGLGDPTYTEVHEKRRPGERIPYEPGSQLRYVYPDDPRGYFDDDASVSGTINEHGFRGASTTLRKRPGTLRIAFLGDSFTLGMGLRDADTLPAQFERLLGEPNVEVLNFGVSGTETPEQMAYLEQRVLQFAPDCVIVVAFPNDATDAATLEFLGQPRRLRALRRHSYLLNAVIGAIERRSAHRRLVEIYLDAYRDGQPGWEHMKDALVRGRSLTAQRGIDFAVALYPILFRLDDGYPFTPIHRKLEGFCRSQRIAFVDLFPAFRGETDQALWVHRVDQHPNEIANRLAAAELVRFVRSRKWLERGPRGGRGRIERRARRAG